MSKVTKAVVLQFGVIALVIAVVAVLGHFFPLVDTVWRMRQKIEGMGALAGVVYPIVYAVCNVLLLPAGVLTMASGFLFGLWWGFLIVLAGNLLGAAVAFAISRMLGRQWIERHLMRRPKLAALDRAIAREGHKVVVLSQLNPLFPTSLINYLYGITRIKFGACMLWVAIGQAPGLFLYVYLGTLGQFGLNLLGGKSHPRGLEYLLWIGGLVLTFALTIALGSLAARLLHEAEKAAPAPGPAPPPTTPALGTTRR